MAGTVREVEVYPICMRELDVLRVEDVTPGMRRVTVGGPCMDGHVRDGVELPPVRSTGFDDDVKLLPVDPVTGTLPFETPTNSATGAVDWPGGSFQYSRTYTVRRFDAGKREMAIDFAAHDGGLASSWAAEVRPGAKILIAGPKNSSSLPRSADWILVAGDETALPAIAHCLEKLPADLPASVVIEVAEPSHRQELYSDAPVDITWLYRSENGGGSRLVDTVQSVPWRAGQPYLWVAGEALTVKPLRHWAKHDMQIPKQFVEIAGYWRRRDEGVAPGVSPDEDAERIHEMAELLPPLALRTAVTLGMFTAVAAGFDTAATVAAECRTDAAATAKLLRHLCSMGMLAADGTRFVLTDTGSILADPDHHVTEALHFEKIHTRLDMAFLGLLHTVRTGQPEFGFAESMKDSTFADGVHDEAAVGAIYRAPALPDAVDLGGVRTVAIYGEGAGVYADALARLRPEISIRLVGLPGLNGRNIADIDETRRERIEIVDASEFVPLATAVDLAVVIDLVDTYPDAEAQLLIGAVRQSAERVVLVTEVLDPSTADEHDTEDDLRRLCLHGSGFRTQAELHTLVTEAGGTSPRFGSLGWGSTVVEFRGHERTQSG